MKKKFLFVVVLFLLYNCESIFVEDLSNKTVVLLAPTNNAEVPKGVVQFDWESLTDANKYQIQIATPDFNNANQILLDSLTTETNFTKELEVENYQWRVKAVNSDYNTAYTTNSFKVLDTSFVSKTVTLLLPIDKDTTNIKAQNLLWEAIANAASYRIQVWQPDTNGTKLEDIDITTTTHTFDFLEGDFTWRVRAEKGTKNTVFSSRTITVDATKPNTPSLDAPINNATVAADTSIQYKWSRADIAGTQELDSIYFYSDAAAQDLTFKALGSNKEYVKDDLTAGTYYWLVRTFDKAGNISDQSTIHTLIIN